MVTESSVEQAVSTREPPIEARQRTIRWAILGTGRIADDFVAAARHVPGAEIAAVAARSAEAARDFAHRHNVPAAHSYSPYLALLEQEEVDVVYIATPNSTHVPLATAALSAGRHVLCEKPLATDGKSAAEVVHLARARNLILSEGFMYRHHAQSKAMLAAVRSGEIGEPCLMRACYSFRLTAPGDIRLSRKLDGGALWDIGVYPVHMARAIFGEPEAVFGTSRPGSTGVDTQFTGILKFPNDRTAIFDCSFELPTRRWVEVVGTRGSIWVENAFMPTAGHIAIRAETTKRDITTPEQNPYTEEIRAVGAAITAGRITTQVDDAPVGNAYVGAALHESARRKTWVVLEQSDI